VDTDKLNRERERAYAHELRGAILDALDGGKERTLPELAAVLPDAAANVLPRTSPEAVLAYHLRVLHRVRLVGFAEGRYCAT
jgi:hypothetical protein